MEGTPLDIVGIDILAETRTIQGPACRLPGVHVYVGADRSLLRVVHESSIVCWELIIFKVVLFLPSNLFIVALT